MSKIIFGSMSPQDWIAQQISATPCLSFSNCAQAPKAIAEWQRIVRHRLEELLGGFPADSCDLIPRQVAVPVIVENSYRREEVVFDSRPGLQVFSYVLTPLEYEKPLPTLLCFHGHGAGVNSLVGLDEEGGPLAAPDYHNNFATDAVRRGYAVIAMEILGFGRRRLGDNCQIPSGAALKLGQTMAGWRAYDAMRAVDYARSRGDVNKTRIGVMGISGGGLVALFLAALDERVRAAVISGFLNEFSSSVMSISHCIDNFIPGLRLEMEMSDIASSIAPRGLWCENGTRDDIFPSEAFERATIEVAKVYDALGASDHFVAHVFDGEHRFDGTGCWEFLGRTLQL